MRTQTLKVPAEVLTTSSPRWRLYKHGVPANMRLKHSTSFHALALIVPLHARIHGPW